MKDLRVGAHAGSALAALFALILISGSASAAGAAKAQTATAPIPSFAPDDHTSWYRDRPDGDNFLPPENGPGPIVSRKDHPYVPNGEEDFAATHPTYRVADLSNPILQPWVIEQMKRDNDEVLAGKIPFMARERCYPGGVPDWEIFRRVAPPMVFSVQTPKEVLMIWRGDNQVRHVYMNARHSAHPKPSWFGESVGHYEADTLVVDTIMIHVEDPGAFTTPWNALQRFARFEGAPRNDGKLVETICAESASLGQFDFGNYGASHSAELAPVPQSDRPDF